MKKCEYQESSTVHIHGYFHLECDPDIIKSAEIVLKIYMAEFCMNKYEQWEFTTGERMSFPDDVKYSDELISDKDFKIIH